MKSLKTKIATVFSFICLALSMAVFGVFSAINIQNDTNGQLGYIDKTCYIQDSSGSRTFYSTIEKAYASATDGDTICVFKDTELSKILYVEKNVTIKAVADSTIDVKTYYMSVNTQSEVVLGEENAEHTLTITSTQPEASQIQSMIINNAAGNTLTINDGVRISSATTLNVQNNGTMVVNGGYIENTRTSDGARSGLYNLNPTAASGTAMLTINGGTISGIRAIDNRAKLTVNGGLITSTAMTSTGYPGAIYNSHNNYGEGDTTIKNGLIKGIIGVVSSRGSVNVQGGEIQADGYGIYSRGSTTTTITDGTIKSTGTAQQSYFAAIMQNSSNKLSISGGTIIGENNANGIVLTNCTGSTEIFGGTISGSSGMTCSFSTVEAFSEATEILKISQNTDKKITITGRVNNAIYADRSVPENAIISIGPGEYIGNGDCGIRLGSGYFKISDEAEISGHYNGVYTFGDTNGEIMGGTLKGVIGNGIALMEDSSVIISGGTITGQVNGIYHESTKIANVKGGTISGKYSIYLDTDSNKIRLNLSGSPTLSGKIMFTPSSQDANDTGIHIVGDFSPASPIGFYIESPEAGQLVVIYDSATWATSYESDFSHSYGLHTEGDKTKIHLGTPVSKPTAGTNSFTYTGSQLTYTPAGYNSTTMNISGNTATNVGSYTATVSFKTNNANLKYLWSGDYNRNDLPFAWSITKADLSAPTNISWNTDPTHTKATATWTQVENATGYSVELYKDGTSIGTYDTTTTSIDLTSHITEESTYTFKVMAIGDSNYDNSSVSSASGNLYKLTFNANYSGGTTTTQYYKSGETISAPKLSRTGYNFIGWATTNTATSENLPQKATVSGTYYAVWETVEYTLNIDANGGTFSQTSGWTGSGTEISRQVQYTVTALGYEDIYRFIRSDSKNTTYDEETGIFTIRFENTGDTGDKYCNWFSKPINGIVTGATYTYVLEILTWETNGSPVVLLGHTASTQDTQLVESVRRVITAPGIYTFTFTGDGTVTNMFSRDFVAVSEGVTLDATFKVAVFPGVVSEEDYEAYKAGSLDSARLPIPTREGYTFNGYFTQANGGEQIVDMYGAVLGDGTIFTNKHIFNNIGNVTLYAQWTINKYTINIDANGGTWTGENSYNANYGSSIEFTTNPTREGYEFEGWYQKNQNGYWAYSNILDPLTAQPFKDVSIGGISQITDVTSDNRRPSVYIPSRNNVSNSEKASKIEKISYTDNDSNPLKTVQASTYYRVTTTKYPTDGDLAYGCYSNTIYARPGYTYYVVIVARFAPGWNISFGANSFGVFESTWISSQAGTGDWETYIFKISIDDSRDKLMDYGYTYLQKQEGANVVSQGTTFDFAYQQIYVSLGKDTQDIDTKFVLLGNETLVARWVSLNNTITLNTNNTKGNYTISSSNLFDKTLVCELNKGYALKVSSGTYSWNGLASVIVDEDKFISTWIPIYPGAKYKITGASGNIEFRYGNNLISDVRSQGIAYTSAQEIIVPTKYYSDSTTQTDTQYLWFRFDAPLSALNNINVEMIDTTITGDSTIILPTGATLSISASAETGYTASINKVSGSGTYSNGELSDIKGNAKLDIMFKPNTNTAYKVEHYQEKIDIATPSESNALHWTLAESESKTGTTDASITPEVKTYPGFKSPSAKTTTISADGSTVVKYYYTRNTYRVTLEYGTGISSVTGGGTCDYGATIRVTATISSGYEFDGWTSNDTGLVPNSSNTSYTFKVPADNVTLTASATPIEYTLTANANDGTIQSTSGWSGTGATATKQVAYLSQYGTLPTVYRTNYIFEGWFTSSTGGTEVTSTTQLTTAGNVTIYAQWTKAAVYNTTKHIGYSDLSTAISGADSTGDVNTLVVLQDLTSTETYTVNKSLTILANSAVTVSGGINVTAGALTLGGDSNTLTIANAITLNGGDLTVKKGTSITGGDVAYPSSGTYHSGIGILNANSTLTMLGGAVQSSYYGVRLIAGSANITGGTIQTAGRTDHSIYNSDGTVNISGTAQVTAVNIGIYNEGSSSNVTISGGKVSATGPSGRGIHNSGIVDISGGTVSATAENGIGINNLSNGSVTISGTNAVSITGETGILNGDEYAQTTGTITIDNPNASVLGVSGIINYSISIKAVVISDGNIRSLNMNNGIQMMAGRLEIKGGSVFALPIEGVGTAIQIYSGATATISGTADISGNIGINNSGILTISGGTISGDWTGMGSKASPAISNGEGATATIFGTAKISGDVGISNMGTLSISGSTISSNINTFSAISTSAGTLTLSSSGDIQGDVTILDSSTVEITGGTISKGIRIDAGATKTLTVSGGKITATNGYGIDNQSSSATIEITGSPKISGFKGGINVPYARLILSGTPTISNIFTNLKTVSGIQGERNINLWVITEDTTFRDTEFKAFDPIRPIGLSISPDLNLEVVQGFIYCIVYYFNASTPPQMSDQFSAQFNDASYTLSLYVLKSSSVFGGPDRYFVRINFGNNLDNIQTENNTINKSLNIKLVVDTDVTVSKITRLATYTSNITINNIMQNGERHYFKQKRQIS